MKKWTIEEMEALEQALHEKGMTLLEAAEHIGRPIGSVISEAKLLGLRLRGLPEAKRVLKQQKGRENR